MDYRKFTELDHVNALDESLIIDECGATLYGLNVKGEIKICADNVVVDGCVAHSIVACGATNALIARSKADDVNLSECFNCSVILNDAKTISADICRNIYVIDNAISATLSLTNIDYLIADGNSCGDICANGNSNFNGNNVTDVDFRPEVGANEDILPHTNKELFVGMERRATIADTGLSFQEYVDACAQKATGIIIVPPGAYSVGGTTRILAKHSGNKIYAYGVYHEYAETDYKKCKSPMLEVLEAQDVCIWGLTLGEVLPSSGQVRVVEKIVEPAKNQGEKDVYKLRIINDAGFLDGFTTTDPGRFHTWWPEVFYNDENGNPKFYCEENYKGSHRTERSYDENGNYDGTMILTIKDRGENPHSESKPAKVAFDKIQLGNVITCRLGYGGGGSLRISDNAKNIRFRDTVVYGHASALSVLAGGRCEQVFFDRHHNTTHSENVIDKETYDKYRALEAKWGVDFEIREEIVNGTIRYRGPRSRSGSVDAFHITKAKEGVNIKASLLECMVDDGSNQHAASSRLHALRDNGDGTTTLYYKSLVTAVYWGICSGNGDESNLSTMECNNFKKGDRLYAYNPYGKPVIDAPVLSDAQYVEDLEYDLTYRGVHKHTYKKLYSVVVRTSDIDTNALVDSHTGREFDLSDIGYEIDNRVTVDNLSANSCNYTMDNVMVYNGHSRGFLIKSTDIKIKHCTFRNVCNAGLLITTEPEWGESTVARDVLVDRCLFDNTGHHFGAYQQPFRSCIRIEGTSKIASRDTLPINNIHINKCKFTNNRQWNAIQVNSAQNIKITGNTFDPIDEAGREDVKGVAVILSTCVDVEITDNVYNLKNYDGDVKNVIIGQNYKEIHGSDVTNADGTPIFPDYIPEQ